MLSQTTTGGTPRADAVRWMLVAALAVATVCYVVFSWHWMLICDSPIMHYVNFLMAHGLKPYSQISDNNLPGSYMTEALAMRVFGSGDLGWRLYEFFVLGAITAAMALIARPYDWVAAVFAGGSFVMMHGKEGPWFAGERELTLTLLVMAGYAAMFVAVRRKAPAWMIAMGFCTAFAASIKPTVAPLGPVLLLLLAIVLYRQASPWLRYLLFGVAGMCLAAVANIGYLLYHHALRDFLTTQRTISVYYAGLTKVPIPALLGMLGQPRSFLLLPVAGLVLAWAQRRWTWEHWALALGAFVAMLSYLVQGKGFLHHRYLLFYLLLLLIGLELTRALRSSGWRFGLAASVVAYVVIVLVPHSIQLVRHVKGDSDLALQLEADLNHLGGQAKLQQRVQCLDLVYGCLNALYHLQIVENTGFTGDLLIFDPKGGPVVEAQRAQWWHLAQQNPADVLVLTNEYFQGGNSFNKIDNWPQYRQFIADRYKLLATRTFPNELGATQQSPSVANGYRIYIRNGAAFPTNAF